MMFPALQNAPEDPSLHASHYRVYLSLVQQLDLERELPVKQEALAFKLSMPLRTVRKAMKHLVDRNYLREGTSKAGEPKTYKLVYNNRSKGVQ